MRYRSAASFSPSTCIFEAKKEDVQHYQLKYNRQQSPPHTPATRMHLVLMHTPFTYLIWMTTWDCIT